MNLEMIIVANKNGAVRSSANLTNKRTKTVSYESAYESGYLNALAVLIETLSTLKENGVEGQDVKIFTLSNVSRAFGRYRALRKSLKKDKKDNIIEEFIKGKSVEMTDEEATLWRAFERLYLEVPVSIREIYGTYKLSQWKTQLKGVRNYTSTLQFKKRMIYLIEKSWNELPAQEEEVFEEVTEDGDIF